MTREESIKRLENIDIRDALQEDYDALHIAIKALEHPERNVVAVVPCGDTISRQAVLDIINFEDKWLLDAKGHNADTEIAFSGMKSKVSAIPSVNPQEPKTGWNNHQIACMLADLFGDACACNYNGIDEWLSELCDFKDTCCPNPVGVACWEQFLKYSQSRYTECGYEVRDKNALQKPKTGHWIKRDNGAWWECSECHAERAYGNEYCPDCGSHNGDIAKMVEPQESEEV